MAFPGSASDIQFFISRLLLLRTKKTFIIMHYDIFKTKNYKKLFVNDSNDNAEISSLRTALTGCSNWRAVLEDFSLRKHLGGGT